MSPAAYRKADSGPRAPGLPKTFTNIRDILDERVSPGGLVNVVGMVKDFRLPTATTGSDFKSTLTLFDVSTQEDAGIVFNVFRPEADMPQVGARDVVVIISAKVQRYRANPLSLISNRSTAIYVYQASAIPRPPRSAGVALMPLNANQKKAAIDKEHHDYVSHFYHEIDKDMAPDDAEFQEKAKMSLNIKDKFSLLKDVRDGRFYDLIAQVARDPFDVLDKVTLYVSDYTENEAFFHYTYDGCKDMTAGGDPYGYTSSSMGQTKKEWVGPYGKKAIQLTCYEPHASFIRSEVVAGDWVSLRNVQIKYGHDGNNLEGFMREERNSAADKVNVDTLEIRDRETMDPRLKEGIRRWRDYDKQMKTQIKEIKSATTVGAKRKAEELEPGEKKLSSKERRRLKRAALEKREAEQKVEKVMDLGLNEQVTCESHSQQAVSTIATILEPVDIETTIKGQKMKVALPFTCSKYLTRVRVVDFYPPALEDFASSRESSAFDVLSDHSGDEDDSDSNSAPSDEEDDRRRGVQRIWEWRFALQLEDAAPAKHSQPKRLWVLVDNAEAQCLTGLDATNLRRDPDNLVALRERMHNLWGTLEEHKTANPSRRQAEAAVGRKRLRRGDVVGLETRPPLESSDIEDEAAKGEVEVSNKPFTCCIKQYGIRVAEPNASKADAGKGMKWVKMFELFGTKICL
ncbi:hypothetical protein B0T19DRAFT_180019 [Cercophora scortea]|uniref:Protection of telomeres protein 1 n=1 Tax=Cercophora scortea TaxID=314031 RepID=A0AAE0IMQ4_9PEZI|nr:hypothetical protein B0T19DRAFT_180019 [Cercophora scortea]